MASISSPTLYFSLNIVFVLSLGLSIWNLESVCWYICIFKFIFCLLIFIIKLFAGNFIGLCWICKSLGKNWHVDNIMSSYLWTWNLSPLSSLSFIHQFVVFLMQILYMFVEFILKYFILGSANVSGMFLISDSTCSLVYKRSNWLSYVNLVPAALLYIVTYSRFFAYWLYT